jgi:hypothetical protein
VLYTFVGLLLLILGAIVLIEELVRSWWRSRERRHSERSEEL